MMLQLLTHHKHLLLASIFTDSQELAPTNCGCHLIREEQVKFCDDMVEERKQRPSKVPLYPSRLVVFVCMWHMICMVFLMCVLGINSGRTNRLPPNYASASRYVAYTYIMVCGSVCMSMSYVMYWCMLYVHVYVWYMCCVCRFGVCVNMTCVVQVWPIDLCVLHVHVVHM